MVEIYKNSSGKYEVCGYMKNSGKSYLYGTYDNINNCLKYITSNLNEQRYDLKITRLLKIKKLMNE